VATPLIAPHARPGEAERDLRDRSRPTDERHSARVPERAVDGRRPREPRPVQPRRPRATVEQARRAAPTLRSKPWCCWRRSHTATMRRAASCGAKAGTHPDTQLRLRAPELRRSCGRATVDEAPGLLRQLARGDCAPTGPPPPHIARGGGASTVSAASSDDATRRVPAGSRERSEPTPKGSGWPAPNCPAT
jgi:hypothetical protein